MNMRLQPLSDTNPIKSGGNSFHWLLDKDDKKFSDYMEREKKYFIDKQKYFRNLQSVIHDEIHGRFYGILKSAPFFYSGYTYEFIYNGTKTHYSLYQKSRDNNEITLVMDFNNLVDVDSYFSLLGWLPNNTHDRVLFWIDTVGNERCHLWLKDIRCNKLMYITGEVGSAAWNTDDSIIFTQLDDKNRAFKVCRLDNVSQAYGFNRPMDIWIEDDERFDLYVSNNRQNDLLYITCSSLECNEVIYAKTGPRLIWKTLCSRKQRAKYRVVSLNHHFLISATTDNIKSLYVKSKTIPHDIWCMDTGYEYDEILEIHAFKRFVFLVIKFRAEIRLIMCEIAQPVLRNTRTVFTEIPLPDKTCIISLACNKEYDPSEVYISYESHLHPESLIKIKPDLYPEYSYPDFIQLDNFVNYSPYKYCSDRIWISSFDDEKIPVTLLYGQSTITDKPCPVVMYAYGAYGFSIEPYFSPARISLLERGYIFAIAHVRGGGELGNDWHSAAKKLTKRISIDDFIACARGLIDSGITQPKKIAVWGESAGGTIIAAALNDHPELFSAAVLDVPFVDVIGNLSNTALPETVQEWDEWGNPSNTDELKAMQSYCPMTNIKHQDYPAVLTLVSLNDVHIPYWEPIIWSLNVRGSDRSNNDILIKIEKNAGHLNSDNIEEYIERSALILAFMINYTTP